MAIAVGTQLRAFAAAFPVTTPLTRYSPRLTPNRFQTAFCVGRPGVAPWAQRRNAVSAWAERNGLALGQLKVSDKTNEISTLPELLRVLELAGCRVTVDAIGCQKTNAREIIEADADSLRALRGNHETVHAEVEDLSGCGEVELFEPRPARAKPSSAA